MKILKIFGIVVGIHVFALILIFANPGCSSTKKTAPSTGDPGAKTEAAPVASTPSTPSSVYSSTTDSSSSVPPVSFNPNAPAVAAPSSSSAGRHVPTRPGTPVAGALNPQPVTDVTPVSTYTVKSGDNLWTIARKHNITVAQLTTANNLSTNTSLRPNQKLVIPGKPTPIIATAPASGGPAPVAKAADPLPVASGVRSGPDVMKHTVKSGETLGGIAKKYDVPLGEIAVANNISDPAKIRPGMELIVPGGWRAPGSGSKSGKSAQKSASAPKSNPSSTPPATPATEPVPSAQLEPTPAPVPPPTVPVIKIDEASASPAPKQP